MEFVRKANLLVICFLVFWIMSLVFQERYIEALKLCPWLLIPAVISSL